MGRLTDTDREKIMADYHIGKSQNFLAKKYEVSLATINKLCKGVIPKHVDNVNTLSRIKAELMRENEIQVNAIQKEVDERTRHIQFFTEVAIKNVQEAMLAECTSQFEFRARAETISKSRETVLGKQPDTAVNVQGNDGMTVQIVRFGDEDGRN